MSVAPRPVTPGLDQAAALARGLKPIARFICLLSLIAGSGSSYGLWHSLQLSPAWTWTAAILLNLPALLYAWLWWLLYALGDLPGRLHGAVDALEQMTERPSLPPGSGGFRRLGRVLGDIWTVLDKTDNVMLPISAAVLLANPVGLIMLGVGFAAAVVLWLIAAVVTLAQLL